MSQLIRSEEAVAWLQTGALGVGEDHQQSAGRLFTKKLIENGQVRILFLECDSSAQAAFDDAVRQRDNFSGAEANIKAIVDNAGPQWFGDGVITLGEVAWAAVQQGIPVYFLDLEMTRKTKRGNPAARDAHAAKIYNDIVGSGGNLGCLVHYGAVHLDRSIDTMNRHYSYDDDWLGKLIDVGYVMFTE